MNSLRVATINLWCRHGDWAQRRATLVEAFAELRPDVVVVQESVVTGDYDQVEDVLGAGLHLCHQGPRAADGSGLSIASRWPFARVHEVTLPRTHRMEGDPAWTGSAAVAELLLPEPFGRVLIAHHKPSGQCGFEAEREMQAVATARFIEGLVEPRAVHVLLAGDFGATPDSSSVRFWLGRQALQGTSVCYRDSREASHSAGESDWAWEAGRRTDYVMARCDDRGPTLRVVNSLLILTKPAAGDHFGVMAEVAPA